jgi:predicted DCC family thiol-disulfide oxidoreductase YuxK
MSNVLTSEHSQREVEVFFDGDCPLCRREIATLRRLDRRGRILFTDLAAPGFDASSLGRSRAEFMERIHARTRDGAWITGVEVFRALYTAVGLGPLVRLSRLGPLDAALERAYEVFARNRLKWTGRCEEGTCRAVNGAA